MKSTYIVVAFLVGSALTAAVTATITHAQNSDAPKAACIVRTSPPIYTGGGRCFGDKVMVGMSEGYLLCSDLVVTCP